MTGIGRGGGRVAVPIIGMHRSGTSYVAGLMPALGLDTLSGRLQFSNRGNAHGNREVREMARVNEWLLYSVGCTWDCPSPSFALADQVDVRRDVGVAARRELESRMPAEGRWYWKDPRLTLVLDVYDTVLSRHAAAIVFVHRPPLEVARSLEARSQLPIDLGIALWEVYNTSALRLLASDRPSVVASFDDALTDPLGLLERIRSAVAQGGATLPPPADGAVRGWTDSSQRHHRDGGVEDLPAEVRELAGGLVALGAGEVHAADIPRRVSDRSLEILRARASSIPDWLPPGPYSLMRHGVTLEEQGVREQAGRFVGRARRELAKMR